MTFTVTPDSQSQANTHHDVYSHTRLTVSGKHTPARGLSHTRLTVSGKHTP